jgi:hypothetical protein
MGKDSNGCINYDTAEVIIHPLPTVLTADVGICYGGTAVFTAYGADTLLWNNGIANGVGFVPTPSSPTSYTVTGIDINGCSSTSVAALSIDSVLNVTTTNHTICTGSAVTLLGAGATSYTWSGGAVNGVPFVPPAPGTYTVYGSSSSGIGVGVCMDSAIATIGFLPLPIVHASGVDTTICKGAEVMLYATGTANIYTWSQFIQDSIPFKPVNSALYVVTGVDANGCTNTEGRLVDLYPGPTIFSDNVFGCKLDKVEMNALSTGDSIWWTGGIVNGEKFLIQQSSVFTVYSIDSSKCLDSVSVYLTAFNPPIVTANNDTSICAGQSIVLNGHGADFFGWDKDVTDGVPFTPLQTDTFVVYGIEVNPNYCTDSETVIVNVMPLPCTPLSVNILNFSGVANNNFTNTLFWKIADENDVMEYQLERRTPSGQFQYLATIPVKIQNGGEYQYLDANIDTIDIYRLKAVEFSSIYSYSQPVTLTHIKATSDALIYPNPANDHLNFVFNSKVNGSELKIQVLDMAGKLVVDRIEKVDIGTYTFNLDVSSFANGNYMIRYVNEGDYTNGVVKFTKTKK